MKVSVDCVGVRLLICTDNLGEWDSSRARNDQEKVDESVTPLLPVLLFLKLAGVSALSVGTHLVNEGLSCGCTVKGDIDGVQSDQCLV